jgi:polyphenol oxidase
MNTQNIKSVPFYFFNNLEQHKELVHFVSTREGGVSDGDFASLNLSLRVNDDPYCVERNRRIVAQSFRINPKQLIFSSQCHSNKVEVIDDAFLRMDEHFQNEHLNGIDALVTNLKGTCISILTADCAAVVLYDPVSKAVGIAHAGWKGTVGKIVGNTINIMSEKFGTSPGNLVAAISPCITADSFEVGEEVAIVFQEAFPNRNDIVLRKAEWAKPHVDIVAANMAVLSEAGVKSGNIEVAGICTYRNPDIFFSARRNAGGRFCTGAMII